MPELLSQTTITASNAGNSIDLVNHNQFARIALAISVVSGSASFAIETSDNGAIWRTSLLTQSISSSQELDLFVYDLGKYLRLRWNVATNSELGISGTYNIVSSYAITKDFYRLVCPLERFGSENEVKLASALAQASTLADSYLGNHYTLPVKTWNDDLTRNVCLIAQYDLATNIGVAQNESYEILKELRDNAVKWFENIGKTIKPQITDSSTPTTTSNQLVPAIVYSSSLRGW